MKKMRFSRAAAVLTVSLFIGLPLAGCQSGSGTSAPEGVPESVKVVPGDVDNFVGANSDTNWSFSINVKDAEEQKAALQTLMDNGYKLVSKSDDDTEDVQIYSLRNDDEAISITLKMEVNEGNPRVIYNIIKDA